MKRTLFIVMLAALAACSPKGAQWSIEDGRFVKEGVPQYYVGTNVWYAPTLALTDSARLEAELDTLHALGLDNLRILGTDENWKGMDAALESMQRRGMQAVIYMNNAWEWSEDGYRSYLEKAGAGRQPHPAVEGYGEYMGTMWKFASNKDAVALFQEHVRRMVTRYKDNPAVFSWQICNEPRPFSEDPAAIDDYIAYLHSTAELIKSIDPVHFVSAGTEGAMGCNKDWGIWRRVHECGAIDYCTIHIWPYNWSWVSEGDVTAGLDAGIEQTGKYIDEACGIAKELGKPVVIEEFGYPRDGFEYLEGTPVTARDKYYDYVFGRVLDSAKQGGVLAGCNFWTWSGFARQTPGHQFWQEGDDLCGDPSQEAQGLNGVYLSDETTTAVVAKYTDKLHKCLTITSDPDTWLKTGDGPFALEYTVTCPGPVDAEFALHLVSDLSLMGQRDTVLTVTADPVVMPEGGSATLSFDISPLPAGFWQANLSMGKMHPNGMHWFPAKTFNIGINPEQISSPQDKPEDFDAFWERTLAELAVVPMNATLTLLPEHSSDARNFYRVEMDSWGGARIGGYLVEPAAPGKYQATAEYMGYGAEAHFYDPDANPDKIEFLVSVRDQGIFREPEGRWIDRGLDCKENFYYRGAFCDVVRALDFLASLEKTDPARIVAKGESQGGAFTWIAASLDHRVAAIAPAVPFLSDYEDYSKIVWWPMWEVFGAADEQGIARADLLEMLRYFDIKNFTDRVECPVYMAFGLQDPTCPPHTNIAGYNQVTSDKKYLCVPTCGHSMWKEQVWNKERAEFLESF